LSSRDGRMDGLKLILDAMIEDVELHAAGERRDPMISQSRG